MGGKNIRFKAAIDYAKLFEISQKRNRGLRTAISVTIDLKIIVVGFKQSHRRTLGLDKETLLTKVWREEKCIVGLFNALSDRDITLDLYFLLIRIGLAVVINVPTECDEKFVDEIFSRRTLVIIRGVIFVVIVRKYL